MFSFPGFKSGLVFSGLILILFKSACCFAALVHLGTMARKNGGRARKMPLREFHGQVEFQVDEDGAETKVTKLLQDHKISMEDLASMVHRKLREDEFIPDLEELKSGLRTIFGKKGKKLWGLDPKFLIQAP